MRYINKNVLYIYIQNILTFFQTIGTIPNSTTDVCTAHTELQQIMPKLKTAMSKMDLEECKHYITCIISEKFAEKALQDKLEELKIEKELDSAMKSLSCLDSQAFIKIIENQKSLEGKIEEIKHLKESIALLEEKLQCVRIYKELYLLKIF